MSSSARSSNESSMAKSINPRFEIGDRVQLREQPSLRGSVVELGSDDVGPVANVEWDGSPPDWRYIRGLEPEATPQDELESALQDISIELAKTADEQGFARVSWDTIPAHLMFVVTEVLEAWDAPDKLTMATELADIAIRLLVQLRNSWSDSWDLLPSTLARNEREGMLLSVELMRVARHLSAAAQHWRSGYTKETKDRVRVEVERALAEVVAIADAREIDLLSEITEKNATNAQRPYLHGRAEALG